jgi:hypothetical protein
MNVLNGSHGTATEVPANPLLMREHALISRWFLHIPTIFSLPSQFALTTIHLRGADDAALYDGAAYELRLIALYPQSHPDVHKVDTWKPIDPPNMLYQFDGMMDNQAYEFTELVAKALVSGALMTYPNATREGPAMWWTILEIMADGIKIPTPGGPH